MPEAIAFQTRFARGIAAPLPPGAHDPSAFAVYRNTWIKALLDTLAANYPVVAMLLGADLFRETAIDFARQHPANTPVLTLYGAQFPAFLGDRFDGEIPYLRDVAMLERLWTECFFAPDAAALGPQQYAAFKPSELLRLCAVLHPAARIARFETPAVTIWRAHRVDGEFQEIEPEWQPEHVLVARRDKSPTVTLLDEATYRILLEIGNGRTIGFAIEKSADACPGSDLANALFTVIESGALTSAAQTNRG